MKKLSQNPNFIRLCWWGIAVTQLLTLNPDSSPIVIALKIALIVTAVFIAVNANKFGERMRQIQGGEPASADVDTAVASAVPERDPERDPGTSVPPPAPLVDEPKDRWRGQ